MTSRTYRSNLEGRELREREGVQLLARGVKHVTGDWRIWRAVGESDGDPSQKGKGLVFGRLS